MTSNLAAVSILAMSVLISSLNRGDGILFIEQNAIA